MTLPVSLEATWWSLAIRGMTVGSNFKHSLTSGTLILARDHPWQRQSPSTATKMSSWKGAEADILPLS